jgi:hypothetical protein
MMQQKVDMLVAFLRTNNAQQIWFLFKNCILRLYSKYQKKENMKFTNIHVVSEIWARILKNEEYHLTMYSTLNYCTISTSQGFEILSFHSLLKCLVVLNVTCKFIFELVLSYFFKLKLSVLFVLNMQRTELLILYPNSSKS